MNLYSFNFLSKCTIISITYVNIPANNIPIKASKGVLAILLK